MKYIKSLDLNEELKGHAKKMKEDGVSDEEIKKMHPEVSDEDLNERFSDKGDIRAMALALKDGKIITARHARFPASFTVLEIDPRGGFATVDYNDGKGSEEMAAINIDPKSIKLSESAEVNEAKKFKPGDMWSNDFDYDGMMKYALKVNHKTPLKTLQKLHDSATDVNYHTPFSGLGNAIDWITDDGVNSQEGKDFMKQFHNDIKDEIKNMN
jgi:major membrane immunogen (membrane-anchored lipoprotein)